MDNNKLISEVKKNISQYKKILLAFSGGLDSTVLLHLLVQLRNKYLNFELRAVHINHELNINSNIWVNYCKKQCFFLKVPLIIKKVKINKNLGGIEAAARNARYTAFNLILKTHEILITAQHLDDQSETFFLALKRGSGISGLSSMALKREFGNNILLRPLINFTHKSLKIYAKKNKLSWINDDSNKNLRFDRNFLRLQILPLLNCRWPYFSSSVARSANFCAEQKQLLNELLIDKLNNLLETDNSLCINGLMKYSLICRFALLRHWCIYNHVTPPSYKQLQNIFKEVIFSRIDAQPCLRLGSYQIRRFQNRLYLLYKMENLYNISLNWSRKLPLILPDKLGTLISNQGNFCLRAPNFMQSVNIRFNAKGHFHIIGRTHSRSIKKIWQELHLPPWLRNRIPLIYYDNQLIAAINIFICKEGQILDKKKSWCVHWKKNNLK
ncbi:tRNA(Ile)-lysidine synthase [Serratia symbiotica]|nr:tRNA(Ile)-lysidine synthase [Serratia symbiotica]